MEGTLEHVNTGLLVGVGDQLQSAASRVAEFVRAAEGRGLSIPYEVTMAVSEVQSCVDDWTGLRRQLDPEDAAELEQGTTRTGA